jgi:hypothetical protein
LDTPIYPVAVTVGGPNQTTSSGLGKVLPKVINTRQSGSIVATFTDADAAAFDISGLSGLDVKAKPYNTSEMPITLGTGVVSGAGNNIFTVSWVRDLFPAGWSSYASDREGAIVIYIELEETGTADYYQWDTRVNVEDGDYTGDASTLPLVNLVFYDNQVYEYDNTTAEADPTAGKFRLNNTTLASVTEMYIADDNKSGVDMQTFWQSLASGSDIYMATATIQNDAVYFTVSGAPTNNVGYTKIPLTYVSEGTTQLTNGSYMSLLVNKLAGITYSDGESINDNNGNELIQFGVVGSAVNEVKITNAATGNGPIIAPAGETNIDLNVNATGTGVIKAGSNLDVNDKDLINIQGVGAKSSTTLTIATGAVTQTQLVHALANESAGATDDLDSIVPATNQTDIYLTMSASGQVPTIKHSTGTNTFLLADDTDLEMVMNTIYHFRHDGTNWKLVGSSASGGAGNFPTATDSGDKTTAYTVVSGDVNTAIIVGSATTADFDITLDVSLFSATNEVITVVNESAYIARVVVSNTGTMTINSQYTDRYVSAGQTVTFSGDTSTNCRMVAGA